MWQEGARSGDRDKGHEYSAVQELSTLGLGTLNICHTSGAAPGTKKCVPSFPSLTELAYPAKLLLLQIIITQSINYSGF